MVYISGRFFISAISETDGINFGMIHKKMLNESR